MNFSSHWHSLKHNSILLRTVRGFVCLNFGLTTADRISEVPSSLLRSARRHAARIHHGRSLLIFHHFRGTLHRLPFDLHWIAFNRFFSSEPALQLFVHVDYVEPEFHPESFHLLSKRLQHDCFSIFDLALLLPPNHLSLIWVCSALVAAVFDGYHLGRLSCH